MEFKGQGFTNFEMDGDFSLYLESVEFLQIMKFTFNAWKMVAKMRLKMETDVETGKLFDQQMKKMENMEEMDINEDMIKNDINYLLMII